MDTCGYFTLLTGVMYVICIFGHENIGVFHLHPICNWWLFLHTDRRMAEVKIFQNKTKLPYEAWMVRSPEILRLRCFLERAQTYVL